MRIVYFLPDIDAGVARIVKALIKYKPQNNDQYVVVLFSSQENRSLHPVADFEGPNEIIRFLYSSRENVYAAYRRLANRVLHSEQDIIVANDGWEIRMVAALKLKNPIAYILHGDFKYYYQVCNMNQGIIDLYIAYSTKVFAELTGEKLEKENHYKVQKLYYPSATLALKAPSAKRDSSVFKILFAGTLNERKGAHLLKDIYNELSLKIELFQLCIIGEGNLQRELVRQFVGCENVIMEGWKSNEYVMEKMSEADVFLFPSSLEGLPNVLIEALYSGAVPVSSRLESGVLDVIEDHVNGCLVEPGDVIGYAEATVTLYNDRTLLNELRHNGKKRLEKFDPHKQAVLYDEVIKKSMTNRAKKTYPKYPMGRILNKPWLPNVIVKSIRSIVNHPKV